MSHHQPLANLSSLLERKHRERKRNMKRQKEGKGRTGPLPLPPFPLRSPLPFSLLFAPSIYFDQNPLLFSKLKVIITPKKRNFYYKFYLKISVIFFHLVGCLKTGTINCKLNLSWGQCFREEFQSIFDSDGQLYEDFF